MKVALIAPRSLLTTIGHMTQYHMILPEHLDDAKYERHWNTVTGYRILDNGIAEGRQVTPMRLYTWAYHFKADEVVVPDTMGRGGDTMEKVRAYEQEVFRMVPKWAERIKHMVVAQGVIMSDVFRCIEYYLGLDWVNTIAFPRCLQSFGQDARLEILESWGKDIRAAGKEIHCLGSTQDLSEVKTLEREFGDIIRGIDTCMPIDIARAGVSLSQGDGRIRYMGRSEGYFDWEPDAEAKSLAVSNCNTYLEWATAADDKVDTDGA
jgi:hypothetical protein